MDFTDKIPVLQEQRRQGHSLLRRSRTLLGSGDRVLLTALVSWMEGLTPLVGAATTVAELLANGVHPEIASLGFVLMLFYASSSINGILSGLNEAHHLERKGNWLLLRAMSMLLMVVFSLFLIVAVLLIVFSGSALDWLTSHGLVALEDLPPIQLVRWSVTLVLLYTTITAMYNAADFSKDRWRFLTPGAVATTLLIVLTSIAFAWFANSLSSYNRLYGSLGTLLLLLVWLNVNCFFLILGFDLDAALNKARRGGERAEWMDEESGEAA